MSIPATARSADNDPGIAQSVSPPGVFLDTWTRNS